MESRRKHVLIGIALLSVALGLFAHRGGCESVSHAVDKTTEAIDTTTDHWTGRHAIKVGEEAKKQIRDIRGERKRLIQDAMDAR
jgi:hypothetical protein